MIVRLTRIVAGLLTLAVLGGGVTVADARPSKGHHAPPRVRRPAPRTVATKIDRGRGWVPAALLAPRRRPAPAAPAPAADTSFPPAVAPAAVPVGDAAPGPDAVADAPVAPAPVPVATVGVRLDETPAYQAQLSRASVAAGTVNVQLQNQGEDPHNLRIVRLDGIGTAVDYPLTTPGGVTTRSLTLAAGQYYLYCTLTAPVSHEAAGMHATLTVTAGS